MKKIIGKETKQCEILDENFNGMQTSCIFDLYWYFASERQKIYYNRIENRKWPWTSNYILQTYKFTNAYRASDRVSQYLLKNIIYKDNFNEEDTLFRILLFKFFNKIETWKALENEFGEITYKTFKYEKYCDLLDKLLYQNTKIYSAAYILPSGISAYGNKQKHRNSLALLQFMFSDGIVNKVSKVTSLKQLYQLLLSYPMIGNFSISIFYRYQL